MRKIHSSLWQNKTPFNIHITFLKIHLSVMRHLGYFHSLVIEKNATINMGCACVLIVPSPKFFVYRSVLLDQMAVLFLDF
jgi:hypothetical protein